MKTPKVKIGGKRTKGKEKVIVFRTDRISVIRDFSGKGQGGKIKDGVETNACVGWVTQENYASTSKAGAPREMNLEANAEED